MVHLRKHKKRFFYIKYIKYNKNIIINIFLTNRVPVFFNKFLITKNKIKKIKKVFTKFLLYTTNVAFTTLAIPSIL